jgi:hypothetical protein
MQSLIKKYSVGFVFFVIFFIYYFTLGKSVLPNGDSGELISTAYFGGIAHTPGYPLYNILGHLFLKFPLPGEVAWRLNLLSVIFHTAALYFFYKTCLLLSKNHIFLSIISTLILAFSYSFWLYSLVAEVFSLQDLFFCLLLYLLFKISLYNQKYAIIKSAKIWSFIFGLAMSNNHMIILLFPSFLYVLISKMYREKIHNSMKETITFGGKLLFLFLLGLTPYLFFFAVGNNINPVSWSYPKTFGDVLHIFLRSNYGGIFNYHDFGFSELSLGKIFINYMTLFSSLTSDLWAFSFFVLGGIVLLMKDFKQQNSKILLFLIGINLLLIALFRYTPDYYSFAVLERIFLSIDIIFIMIAARFIFALSPILKSNLYKYSFYSIIVIILFFEFIFNHKKADQSQNHICRDYYQDVVRTIPTGSIVLVNGDIQSFCLYYYLFVLKEDFKKSIYIFPTYFIENNQGQYLKKYMKFDINLSKSYGDILKKKYQKTNIFLVKTGFGPEFKYVPLGIFKKVVRKDTNINWEELYTNNKKWWQESKVLKHYKDADFLNLGNKALKEYYCKEYLGIPLFFQQNKQEKFAMQAFKDLSKFCSVDDFSQNALISVYQNLQKYYKINNR